MIKRLHFISTAWSKIPPKRKPAILRRYQDKFGISRHTANNTVVGNGKRSPSAVDPKELRFLEKELSSVLNELKSLETEHSDLETLIND